MKLVNSLVLASVIGVAALVASCGGGKSSELHVFVWTSYLDPEVTAAFEKETGTKVVESNYSSNEEMRAKLQTGAGGYDLVCPTDYMVVQLVKDGLLRPIETAKLTNAGHLAERFRKPAYDPALTHSVPFQWGVTGIGWDATKVQDPPRSWKAFFDAARDGRHGKVSLLDDQREVLGAALLALGHSPNATDEAQIRAAQELIASCRANVEKFDSDGPAVSLVEGQVAVAHGWSGQFANGRRDDPKVSFLVPSEGAFQYVDNWAIPAKAENADLAHRFIDYLLRPEVAAKLVEKRLYASCNEAATKLLPAEITQGIGYSTGDGVKLWWVEDVGAAGDAYQRAWDDLRAE